MNPYALIFAAGLLGGAMNALVGGGSFITMPALISAGVPSVPANASSTVGLVPGGVASAWAYRDRLGDVGNVSLRSLLAVTMVGGAIGAFLLLWTPTRTFDHLLPWLLLIATLTLAFGRQLGERLRRRYHIKPSAVLAMQFALGIYCGYFGGAVSIMMLALWGLFDERDLKTLNAPRTVMVTAGNATAVLIFVFARLVRWPQTLVLMAGATIGGYFGAHVGRRAPAPVIRAATLFIAATITVIFFVRACWKH